jgi:hypothetical protein
MANDGKFGSNANIKARRPKGYKPFWEKDEEPVEEVPEEEAPVKEDDGRFKLVKGLMKKGLGPVIGKK